MGTPRALLGLACLGFVALGLRGGLLGVAWPSIRATFDLPLDALSILLATQSAAYLLASFVSGRLITQLNLGALLGLSALAMGLNLLGVAVAPAWWPVVALGCVGGLGEGVIDGGLNTFVASRHGSRALNWLHACFGVGVTISPLALTGLLAAGLPWRAGYGLVGVLLIALAAGYGVSHGSWPRPGALTRREGAVAVRTPRLRATLRLPRAWLVMALFLVYAGIEVAAGQWAFSLFTEARGLPAAQAGLWVSGYWGCLTLGRVLYGAGVKASRAGGVLRACLVGVVLGAALVWLPALPVASAVGLALLGLAQAPIYPVLVALTPGRFGRAHAANVVGFEVAAAVLGGAALPAGVGLLADRGGLEILGPTLVAAAMLQLLLYQAWAARPPLTAA